MSIATARSNRSLITLLHKNIDAVFHLSSNLIPGHILISPPPWKTAIFIIPLTDGRGMSRNCSHVMAVLRQEVSIRILPLAVIKAFNGPFCSGKMFLSESSFRCKFSGSQVPFFRSN
ncbi:hypothetical protein AVEN_118749-1 [Araneus ventricosus]|uniref:Uncharacterized protein n=1 Tax=Araneus ventricosus TaxID=182803 RepID=A0A4Y2BYJ1_ARAVE|nr:hypothetical protein AVEN_118749-1 [Araneus ventricosus]